MKSKGKQPMKSKGKQPMNKDRYCILPSGNAPEFPKIDAELQRRGVRAQYTTPAAGGRLYRIPALDLRRLPKDEKGRYLGDDNSGHSIYPMLDIEAVRKRWRCGPWIDLV